MKMRIWILVTFIISFILVAVVSGLEPMAKAAETHAPADEFMNHLDGRIPALMKLYQIPGSSIALVRDGKMIWSKAYGYADVENKIALTTDTPMRVQSISKSVTAWGVMKLADEGMIDLDAPAAQYLKHWHFPEGRISASQVTIRQLLSHTAGLPLGNVFAIYAPWEAMPSLEEKLTKEAVPTKLPGAFSYSNTGYNLLELLIEEVTGRDFPEYMQREILIPLGMERSTFMWSDAFDPAVPVGYDLSGRPVPVYVYPEKASGGLFSTAEDIAAFATTGMPDKFHSDKVLAPESIKAMYTPVSEKIGIYGLVFNAYGIGHYIETLPSGGRAVSHGGQGTGIMTHFHAVPETGDAIVILTNSQRSWPFIACVLSDWARWRGFPSVGMGRIIWGQYGLWAAIGLIWWAMLLQTMRLTVGVIKDKRNAAQRSKRPRWVCLVQAGAALFIICGLIWCLCQKYLFLTSVFPRASLWLGITALALSVILILSAWLPMREKAGEF